jgi:hypothetical protein
MTGALTVRWILIAAGVAAIPVGVSGLRPIEESLEAGHSAAPLVTELASRWALDSLGLIIVDHNPFRLTRSPSAIAYSPRPAEPAYVEPPPPKPQLVLTGIVWGDEPNAVVEGIPGMEGPRLLRAGEAIATLRVRRITQHEVTIMGMDTTWVLRVRTPW